MNPSSFRTLSQDEIACVSGGSGEKSKSGKAGTKKGGPSSDMDKYECRSYGPADVKKVTGVTPVNDKSYKICVLK